MSLMTCVWIGTDQPLNVSELRSRGSVVLTCRPRRPGRGSKRAKETPTRLGSFDVDGQGRHMDLISRVASSRRRDGLALVAAGCAIVAIAALVWHAATGRYLDVNGHCGYDGFWYCRMARGAEAQGPFNRRVLAPFVVRLLHFGSVEARFLLLDFVGTILTAALAGVIAARIADRRRPEAAVITASIVLLFPFMWQLAVVYPVNTDISAAALGFAWVASIIRNRPGWVAPPLLAAAAVLTRESWVVPIALACAVLAWSRRDIMWRMLPSVPAALAAFFFALSQPELPGPDTGFFGTFKYWIHRDFGSFGDITLFAWFVIMGLGLTWLILVTRWRWVLGDWRRRTLLAVALGHAVLAVIGGGDTDRLLLDAGIALTAVAVAALADGQVPLAPFTALLAGTVILWRPWYVSLTSASGFLDYWGMRENPHIVRVYRYIVDFPIAVIAVLAAVVLAWSLGTRLRRLPTAAGPAVSRLPATRALQRTQHRRALYRQAQAVPRRRNPLRQARTHLPRHR
jgi:hypothetical protein